MSRYSHKPDLSVRYSPRVTRRFRARIGRLCRRHEMPESDILRYAFEASVLTNTGRVRQASSDPRMLDAMVTIRTGRSIGRLVSEIWRANPEMLKADVLRVLLERMIAMAERRGMAAVMKMREDALR